MGAFAFMNVVRMPAGSAGICSLLMCPARLSIVRPEQNGHFKGWRAARVDNPEKSH